MTDDDIKDLKKDLLQLFMKYNVSIGLLVQTVVIHMDYTMII